MLKKVMDACRPAWVLCSDLCTPKVEVMAHILELLVITSICIEKAFLRFQMQVVC
jgi:hypothetical protein